MFLLDNNFNRASDADQLSDDGYTYPPKPDPAVDANPNIKADAVDSAKAREKMRLVDEAKRIMRRGIDRAPGRLASRLGAPANLVKDIQNDTPEGRERVKDYAKDKAREFAKDKVGGQLKGGLKKGFEKGISEGAGKAFKEGGKSLAKGAAKGVAKGVSKAGAKVGTGVAVEGGIAAAGAVAGAATFGLGFILSLFLDIAISLGVNDAVDALFELKQGNVKQATFLALRAAVKVEVFVWFLVTVILMFSVAGIFIAIPSLILLNIYMLLGAIPALKSIPHFQGMVWWEMVILIVIDFIAFLILAAFIGGIVYYLCQSTGLGGGGVSGAVTTAAVGVYDWWSGSSGASFANDICKNVNVQ